MTHIINILRRNSACLIIAAAFGFGISSSVMAAKPETKSPAASQATQPASQKSLYERLGGYDAITAVVNDFADRLVADPKLTRSFGGFSGPVAPIQNVQHPVGLPGDWRAMHLPRP